MKKVISISYIAPNENVAWGSSGSLEFDRDYMQKKYHKNGPLKLIQYTITESTEYVEDGLFGCKDK